MIDFNYQTGDSILHKMDPAIKFCGLILFSCVIVVLQGLSLILASVILISVFLLLSQQSVKKIFTPVLRFIPFFTAILLVNTVFYNNTECQYRFWLICISKAGFLQGIYIVVRTITIFIMSSVFIKTTSTIEIMETVEKILSPLRIIKVPVKDISLIMSISIQFIPIIFYDFERIRKAQITRGADLNNRKTILDKVKTYIPIIIPTFISVFRRADELSMAIEARGYNNKED